MSHKTHRVCVGHDGAERPHAPCHEGQGLIYEHVELPEGHPVPVEMPAPGVDYHPMHDGLQWWRVEGRAGLFKSPHIATMGAAKLTDEEIADLQGEASHISIGMLGTYLKAREEKRKREGK